MKIVSLEVQNVKRVKAVTLEPSPDGLTTIGGRNGQGKTSVLDALAYALGGEKLAPTNYRREGAAGESRITNAQNLRHKESVRTPRSPSRTAPAAGRDRSSSTPQSAA